MIYGFIGALLVVVLLGSGVVVGWKLKSIDIARTQRVTAEALTVEQQTQLREEREAWNFLHNYNAADAYGLNTKKPEGSA